MTYSLFLDDERFPPNNGKKWAIVRDCEEAISHIKDKGYPHFISFDHDLGENKKTGYDFAKWVIEDDLDYNWIGQEFDFFVHSMNTVGAKNIQSYMSQYLKHKGIVGFTGGTLFDKVSGKV